MEIIRLRIEKIWSSWSVLTSKNVASYCQRIFQDTYLRWNRIRNVSLEATLRCSICKSTPFVLFIYKTQRHHRTTLQAANNLSKGCIWRSDHVCVNVNKCVKRVFTLSTDQTYFWSSFFWDFTQRRLVAIYRRFGTTYRSHLQGSSIALDPCI